MNEDKAIQMAKELFSEWVKENQYFVVFNADEAKEGDYESPMRGKYIRPSGTQLGESLHWAIDADDDEPYESILEALDDEIGYGKYLFEEGGNWVHCYPDYGFATLEEAMEAHKERLKEPHYQAELKRLEELREIKKKLPCPVCGHDFRLHDYGNPNMCWNGKGAFE
tara:strand:- start:104 stop:604 length:501 start_codon:yes stop_codon:yes gene_type:complete